MRFQQQRARGLVWAAALLALAGAACSIKNYARPEDGGIGTPDVAVGADLPPPVGTCNDRIRNNLETDFDCGGPNCSPCAGGKMCVLPRDCVIAACTAGI